MSQIFRQAALDYASRKQTGELVVYAPLRAWVIGAIILVFALCGLWLATSLATPVRITATTVEMQGPDGATSAARCAPGPCHLRLSTDPRLAGSLQQGQRVNVRIDEGANAVRDGVAVVDSPPANSAGAFNLALKDVRIGPAAPSGSGGRLVSVVAARSQFRGRWLDRFIPPGRAERPN